MQVISLLPNVIVKCSGIGNLLCPGFISMGPDRSKLNTFGRMRKLDGRLMFCLCCTVTEAEGFTWLYSYFYNSYRGRRIYMTLFFYILIIEYYINLRIEVEI